MNRIFAIESDGVFVVPVISAMGSLVRCQSEALGVLCGTGMGVLTAPVLNVKSDTESDGVLQAEKDMAISRNQTPTFVARLTKASGEIIAPSSISAIAYTIQKLSNTGLSSGQTYVDVEGHVNVSVPNGALKPIPISDAFWQDVQTGSGLTEPKDAIDGVLIHVADAGTGKRSVDLYYNGELVNSQTMTSPYLGSSLSPVDLAAGKQVTYNTSRSTAIDVGSYPFSGGTDSTPGEVSHLGELLAGARENGTWSNYTSPSSATIRGYNFSAEPNTVTTPAFADIGTYSVQFKFTQVSGNPIVASWQVKVSQ